MRHSSFLGLGLPELPDEADIRVISNSLETIDSAFEQSAEASTEARRDINLIESALQNKVNKEDGKKLSSEDYTTEEKSKLSGIETGANRTIVDSELSNSSVNPVQNKIISEALQNKADISGIIFISDSEPINRNCIWFKPYEDSPEYTAFLRTNSTPNTEITSSIDGTEYGVENATTSQDISENEYNFTIL